MDLCLWRLSNLFWLCLKNRATILVYLEMLSSFPVHGQGVFIFNTVQDVSSCTFRLISTDSEVNELIVEFSMGSVSVRELSSEKPLIDPTNTQGLSPLTGAYYWFSLDSQNQCLYAGVGEARLETAIYSYKFPPSKSTKQFLESITSILYSPDIIQPLRLLKDPITNKIPLKVKDTHELTMEHIASSAFMPKANLSHIGQKLYDCISGKQFVLNTPDFPDFTQAI